MGRIIEAFNLKKHYRRGSETVKALDGVDFEIGPGKIVSIVGPSGSGKTTLMNLVSCLDTPTDGRLKIAGEDVTKYTESQLIRIRSQNIGFVFQQFFLIPTLTVRENIQLPLVFAGKGTDQGRVDRIIEHVGLKDKGHFRISMLSSGDKQRVSIARALINAPHVVIADEPTGKLENQVRDSILSLFSELSKTGLAIFIATHDLELAEQTERIIHLQDGRIVSKEESSLYW